MSVIPWKPPLRENNLVLQVLEVLEEQCNVYTPLTPQWRVEHVAILTCAVATLLRTNASETLLRWPRGRGNVEKKMKKEKLEKKNVQKERKLAQSPDRS